MRILIADDEAAICDLLADLLGGVGHAVAVAHTYQAARLLLDAEDWDVMLADMVMPGGDGLALVKAARARGMRAVLCTGYPEPDAKLAERGIGYLQKPFSLEALLTKIAPPDFAIAAPAIASEEGIGAWTA
jgi:DNA-binding response OmpR family regulator